MGDHHGPRLGDRIRSLEQLRRIANALSPDDLELLIEWAEGLKTDAAKARLTLVKPPK